MCQDSAGTRHCGGPGCAGALPISAGALSSAHNASQQLEVALEQLGVAAQKVGVVAPWHFLGSLCVAFACLVCALSMPLCMTPFYVLFFPCPCPQACQLLMCFICPSEMPFVPPVCMPHWATPILSVPLHPTSMLLCRLISCPLVPSSLPVPPPGVALCPLLSHVPLRCRRCRSWHGGHAAGQRRRWSALRPPAAVQRRQQHS